MGNENSSTSGGSSGVRKLPRQLRFRGEVEQPLWLAGAAQGAKPVYQLDLTLQRDGGFVLSQQLVRRVVRLEHGAQAAQRAPAPGHHSGPAGAHPTGAKATAGGAVALTDQWTWFGSATQGRCFVLRGEASSAASLNAATGESGLLEQDEADEVVVDDAGASGEAASGRAQKRKVTTGLTVAARSFEYVFGLHLANLNRQRNESAGVYSLEALRPVHAVLHASRVQFLRHAHGGIEGFIDEPAAYALHQALGNVLPARLIEDIADWLYQHPDARIQANHDDDDEDDDSDDDDDDASEPPSDDRIAPITPVENKTSRTAADYVVEPGTFRIELQFRARLDTVKLRMRRLVFPASQTSGAHPHVAGWVEVTLRNTVQRV